VDPVRRIADAVLYEGYILWPYRRSAMKNRQRWTFGGVFPAAWSAERPDDRSIMQTQGLLQGGDGAEVEVTVRFLQVVERRAERKGPDGFEAVDEIEVRGERHLSWEEATEREVSTGAVALGELASPRRVPIRIAAGEERESLEDAAGEAGGALTRSWQSLKGELEVSAERVGSEVHRLTARISNATPWEGGTRDEALGRTFCSAHTVLRVRGGEFSSLTDPPAELRGSAQGCENVGTWPVLVGEDGDRTTLLSSPIILPDYPQVAPESPGNLFDATEIDQLLVLNILSLTDEEKREMRASDPRAREILERTEALSEEEIMRLHGAIRELGELRVR
jgi:hypothetical protein